MHMYIHMHLDVCLTSLTPFEPTGEFQSHSKEEQRYQTFKFLKVSQEQSAEHEKVTTQRDRLHVFLDISKFTMERTVLLLPCLQENLQSEVTITQR